MSSILKPSTNIKVRRSNERGHANLGWLNSYFTFSFADYYNPQHMGYRTLRVLNDDTIDAGQGFGMHPHKDMEIVSYLIEGDLQHKDNMGHGAIIKEGNLQRITAGTGILHSEFNPSSQKKTHLLQIWILPEQKGLKPSYQELNLRDLKKSLTLIASNQEKEGIIQIHQDVQLYRGYFTPGKKGEYELKKERGIWIQMIKGQIEINGIKLQQGDGASVENENIIHIQADRESEFLMFDLK